MIVEIVAGDFLASGEGAFGLRVVIQRDGILEGGEDGCGVVFESALGGVACSEVHEWSLGRAELIEGDGEGVAGEGPVGAVREHGEREFLVGSFQLLVKNSWSTGNRQQLTAKETEVKTKD